MKDAFLKHLFVNLDVFPFRVGWQGVGDEAGLG